MAHEAAAADRGHAARFLDSLAERSVGGDCDDRGAARALGGAPFRGRRVDDAEVVAELVAAAEPGVVGSQTGRYFGFVIGSALPAALAADWLATDVGSERLLGRHRRLPPQPSRRSPRGGSPSCSACRRASRAGSSPAPRERTRLRSRLRARTCSPRAGWDVAADGLVGAPRIRVLVGAERHVTIDALAAAARPRHRCLERRRGGRAGPDARRRAPRGARGGARVRRSSAPRRATSTRARSTRLTRSRTLARATEAWLHVDGAFGLWAAARPRYRQLVDGVERADSWATDAHKWLNVPYDCGIVFCEHPDAHAAAMAVAAGYLQRADGRSPADWVPESSRRARGFAV